MTRLALVVLISIPSLAFSQFSLRRSEPTSPNAEPRQLAQRVTFPQQAQQQQQQAPPPQYNMQPPAQPVPEAPPAARETPRRSRSTPAPRRTPRAETNREDGVEEMAAKLDKDEKKAKESEDELAKSADEATTIVASFLRSANDGVYTKAATHLTPELQKYFESEISAVNGPLKTVLDQLTRGGDIRSVTYSNATVRGEGAVVDAELTYGSGAPERRLFDLLKTKSGWKIVLSINGEDNGQAAPPPQPRASIATPPPARNTSPEALLKGLSTPTPAPTPAAPPAAAPATGDEGTTGGAAAATESGNTAVASAAGPEVKSALADAPWKQ